MEFSRHGFRLLAFQCLDGNHGKFVRRVALVCVADVELALVLDGVGVAEVCLGVRNSRRAVENRGTDEADFAKEGLIRLANGDGQGRAFPARVGSRRADEVPLAGAQNAGVGLAGRHREV